MDKYIKVKKIGEGSFGKAILVKQKDNGEQFVVKEIGISQMKPKERNEARKEVAVLSKMRHPNIVQYVESFEENGQLYIVMEYCEGGDLYALINKQKGVMFNERQVLDWFVQICLALKHVHDRKILHRDIKTSNIFLTRKGSIKLGDFGIARVLNNTMELARTCIGTPYYLSPEICENKPYNNKSDVWALGCVVYEILTLKHAFEAGNMKNLVLKIIRGSYPPVPSRYSYDLRSLVSQLFRRNPRERPSVNSILKKSFVASLTVKFLSPEQHESEFSHTVLHKAQRKPPSRPASAANRYQPVAEKRLKNLEVRGAPINARNQQIAAAYGPSVAAKRQPRQNVGRPAKVENAQRAVNGVLEQRRQQLIEEQQQRKEKILAEKKKRLEDLQRRQKERAQKKYEDQLKKDRDAARFMNLQRSAEMLDDKIEVSKKENSNPAVAARNRPISAPPQREGYSKYHEYLDKLEKGDRPGAANVAAPFAAQGLNKVREAWEERNKAQNAILNAQVNREAGENAANRAQVVNEYLQRRQEALYNKQKGNNDIYGNRKFNQAKGGVAAALQPYSAKSKEKEDNWYMDRLQQIRQQNYHERKVLQNKHMNNKPYKVVDADPSTALDKDEELKKKKINALQQQANDRARILQQNMQERRKKMEEMKDYKKKFDKQARARGIVPPDERPVKYNPAPIGITQALQAVGAPILDKDDETTEETPAEITPSPSKLPDSDVRKRILHKVNQRFSLDFDEDEKKDAAKKEEKSEEKETDSKPPEEKPRPLPTLPDKKPQVAPKPAPWKAWGAAGDIGMKIGNLPLQETASQMDATVEAKPLVPKRQWAAPGATFVNRLKKMTINQPTMTMAVNDLEETSQTTTISSDETTKATDQETSKENKEVQPNDKTVILSKKTHPDPEKSSSPRGNIRLAPKFQSNGTFVIRKPSDSEKKTERKEVEDVSDEEIEDVVMLEQVLQKREEDAVSAKSAWVDEKKEPVDEEKGNKEEKDKKTEEPHEVKKSVTPPRPLPPTPSISESPLFTKRNKPSKDMMATSPVKAVSETPKEDPLSKSLYSTASDRVLMKLTLGQFDSPSPKLLRTCSLPDLTKIPESKEEDAEEAVDPAHSVDVSPAADDSDLPRMSVSSSMNDTNFDEDEEVPDLESSADEEAGCHGDAATDDEEMEMRAQLQNALQATEESSSPSYSAGFAASHKLLQNDESDEEGWESGSDSSSSFEDHNSDDDEKQKSSASDNESVFCRLERNREQLEKELGFEAFLNAYKSVQAIHEDEDEEVARCQESVRAMLGDRFEDLYPRILQLVMADGAYCEDND